MAGGGAPAPALAGGGGVFVSRSNRATVASAPSWDAQRRHTEERAEAALVVLRETARARVASTAPGSRAAGTSVAADRQTDSNSAWQQLGALQTHRRKEPPAGRLHTEQGGAKRGKRVDPRHRMQRRRGAWRFGSRGGGGRGR